MSSIIRATTTSGLQVAPDNSGSLQLQTNGTTAALTIDTSQNIGIGTTGPSYKLDVAGQVASQDAYLITANSSGTPSAGAFIFRPASNTIALGTASTERMRIDSSGNVGIGTTSPGAKLEVYGGNIKTDSVSRWIGYWESDTVHDGYFIPYDGSGFVNIVSSFTTGGIKFLTGTSKTERMRIDSNGYVTNAVNGLGNGLHQAQLYYRLNSTNVGSNATGAQSVFGVGVTLVGSTQYEFETLVILTKTAGTTSHTITFGFGGTATINNILICASITDANSTLPLTPGTSTGAAATSSSLVITSALSTANRVESFLVKGTVSINSGGTFIPQYTLSAAPGGAYTTQIGSYFKISPLAASGANVNIGSWA